MPFFPSVNREEPVRGYMAVKNTGSSKIDDGVCCMLDTTQSGEARAYSVKVFDDVNKRHLIIGVAHYNNKYQGIPAGKWGLCCVFGPVTANKAGAAWSVGDVLIGDATAGSLTTASGYAIASGASHDRGVSVATAIEPVAGGSAEGQVFVSTM